MTSLPATVHVSGRNKPFLPKDVSQPPDVAVPTVILFAVTLTSWICVHILYAMNVLPYWMAFPLWTMLSYINFTPMHDALHCAIASNNSGHRYLNEVIGRLSGIMLCTPYRLFCYVHLQHHKFTNIESHDPDHWSGEGPWYILPFKWCTQMFRYLFLYSKIIHTRTRSEIIEYTLSVSLLLYMAFVSEYNWTFWSIYFKPGFLAAAILAFAFDYLPHRPHVNEDIFIGTNVTSLYGETIQPLTLPLLWQNYHNIHHLYPWIPFYRYSRVWYRFESVLMEKGTKIKSLWPIF